ncbi:hypothetical protein Dtox_4092 [Desulfofarcimen acetoxidans DSM 771]|uniref:Uncharacterized protein n=1 Tax=Desulfofarcimen acetoxidans (strain ATCC 49208 / DSM 771 / KCTC 5769 / VKM B-1644 / 5575) TaxID=485916 RepID=C8VYP4_DESAS|nr:hypothetical protein Dtox_4092 [Desulfofarcimen acetoxidans DSM 771]
MLLCFLANIKKFVGVLDKAISYQKSVSKVVLYIELGKQEIYF